MSPVGVLGRRLRRDLRNYLRHQLRTLAAEAAAADPVSVAATAAASTSGGTQPEAASDRVLDVLLERCDGLFVYARTALQHLKSVLTAPPL